MTAAAAPDPDGAGGDQHRQREFHAHVDCNEQGECPPYYIPCTGLYSGRLTNAVIAYGSSILSRPTKGRLLGELGFSSR